MFLFCYTGHDVSEMIILSVEGGNVKHCQLAMVPINKAVFVVCSVNVFAYDVMMLQGRYHPEQ